MIPLSKESRDNLLSIVREYQEKNRTRHINFMKQQEKSRREWLETMIANSKVSMVDAMVIKEYMALKNNSQ